MRKSNHGISLILVLVLVLVLSVAVFAGCNSLSIPNDNLSEDLGNGGVDIVDNDTTETVATTSIAPTVEPMAYNIQNTDDSQMLACDEYVIFDISCENEITTQNLSTFVEVLDRDGNLVEIKVGEYNGVYVVSKKEGMYTAGATYTISLLDETAFFAGKSEDLRNISFTINKEYISDQVYQDGIVIVNPDTVTYFDLFNKDTSTYELDVELIVGYDVSSKEATEARFAVGNLFVIANSLEEVTVDSTFGKITEAGRAIQTSGSNRIAAFFFFQAPTMEEVYSALNIFTVDQVDCSEIEIDPSTAEAVTSSIRNSQMFYDFAEAIYIASEEAGSTSIKDTVTGFLDNFKVASEITHEGRGFGVAFSIEYLSDVNEEGKCMYAKIAYGGNITYDVQAYSELDGTKFYYDYALIVNTDHMLTISIQWIDSETDTIVLNDEELAQKISAILADRNQLTGTIFGDAKAVSKEFTVPLITTLTYVIPNTPITMNLDLNWFLALGVQAELYNETAITTVDTIGVRSVALKNSDKLMPVPYTARSYTINNNTMLFGTLTLTTGVNADAYFSIVGMSKWLRIGLDARVGVYLELDGVLAKTETADENIKTAAGEFGWFGSVAVEYKVFVLNGKVAGVEAHEPIVTFGQDIITLGWTNETETIVLEKVTPIIGDENLYTLNQIDLPAYEADKAYLTFVNPIEVDTNWTVMTENYSCNDFEYSFADDTLATYANGSIIVLATESFESTMTMTLKADAGVTKTFAISYTAPEVVEENGEEPVAQNYTITFINEGNVTTMTGIEANDDVTLPVPTREYYVFNCWLDLDTSSTWTYNLNMTAFQRDITLIAQWNHSEQYSDSIYVSTVSELLAVSNDLSAKYLLLNDINLGGAEWTPIGTESAPFAGVFDGNNKSIYGFKISKAVENAGFFGCVSGTVQNLKLSNSTINFTADKTDVNAGILAGVLVNESSKITNCFVTSSSVAITMKGSTSNYKAYAGGFVGVNNGLISGENATTASVSLLTSNVNIDLYAGGFVALNNKIITRGSDTQVGRPTASGSVSARISNSVNVAESCTAAFVAVNKGAINNAYVYGSYTFVSEKQGGLVAVNNGNIKDCKVGGTFTFTVDNVGGIAGVNEGKIEYCQANCTIKANDEKNVGGIVGDNNSQVESCSTSGSIVGNDNVGGIAGSNKGASALGNCFSSAAVKATKTGIWGIGAGSAGNLFGED